jgi:hypothetical protein
MRRQRHALYPFFRLHFRPHMLSSICGQFWRLLDLPTREESIEMCLDRLSCLDSKARGKRIERSIGQHLGGVNVQLAAPHESGLLALLDNGVKEAPKSRHTIACADASEA